MIPGTLVRYFGLRFFIVVAGTFLSLFALIMMIDVIELMRRYADNRNATALVLLQISFYRVPYITERVFPFAVQIGAMVCYLGLSRRLELVVARSAGMSAWQFVRPALVIAMLIGIGIMTVYNPLSAEFRDRSEQMEAQLSGNSRNAVPHSSFWLRQRSEDGQSIINAGASRQQGIELSDVSIFRLDESDGYLGRLEAKRATLHNGFWRLEEVRVYSGEALPVDHATYDLKTNLTPAQVQDSFAAPETVPFWQLSSLISIAESSGLAAVTYKLQYYQLLAMPFYLAAMVLLAAAVSLRLFRFGGIQKMILGGIVAGFLLYVLSKITGDLSRASLMPPALAAMLPPVAGGLVGFMALLYQEDG
ncbi:MAG: LPS export ABC transporter permease LptG [Hyphomicrobiales bacterium]|nr:LPS export ABC transporter permease LptG [Hyphomicrobiales bacterium]